MKELEKILNSWIYKSVYKILSKDKEIQIRRKGTDIPDIWMFLSIDITEPILSLISTKIDECKDEIKYWFENKHHWDNPEKDILKIIKNRLEEK